MTAKQLRRQAEYVVEQWDNHDKFRMVEGDESFMNADGEPDAVTFARHILSTVRDDDDEPVTMEFVEAFNLKQLTIGMRKMHYLPHDMVIGYHGKTRGQFRSLCKGLGIVLEERQ